MHQKNIFTYENTALFCMLVKVFIWNLAMVLVLCAGAFLNDGTEYFFHGFLKLSLQYFFTTDNMYRTSLFGQYIKKPDKMVWIFDIIYFYDISLYRKYFMDNTAFCAN